jgi:cytochrome P450
MALLQTLSHVPQLSGAQGFRGHVTEFEADRFGFLARVAREARDVTRLSFPTRDLLIVNSPEAIHEVLVSKAKSFEKSPIIRLVLYPLAGEGLFTAGGALWRRQRRLMAPVFHHAKIDALAPAMVECAERAAHRWNDGDELNVANETTRIAMAVAGRTLFGIDTFDEADEIGHSLTVALDWADQASMALPVVLQMELRLGLLGAPHVPARLRPALKRVVDRLEMPIPWPTPRNRELQRAIALLDARVQRMIDARRNATDPSEDLLTHLLRARDEDDGGVMDDKQVRDEILTLFVAGHETTANGLAWSIYLLARHPEAYARARAAVDALGGRAPTLADLDQLEFLTRVFKEALRMYPPVYLFARISTAETTIAGYAVPERTIVMVSPWTIHHRPDVWPDPMRFDPDRFLPEAEAARPRDAWIPFSDGPRVCIGMHFAMIEAPLVLATMLQHADFELTTNREIVGDRSATLRPTGGIPVRIRTRDHGKRRVA